ncbi:hypothetical protein GAYE_SCF03G2276 [Galdieria yellowstonensis]|uniref:Protein YIPF n=1 Tax=Galdieria yellowstonensis TaxID=3028027 RepID=A0AAV9IAQ4_9RHOD|nr:hypothetical protein GAYE_SCF03G2276 [Galdieria yellowstonensis]
MYPRAQQQASGFYQSTFINPTPEQAGPYATTQTSSFEDEPPLLEELGVDLRRILEKAKAVLNPFASFDHSFGEDADMAGPLLFCLLLGFVLLFSGKVHFGVIYGQAIIGCLSIYVIVNLMSSKGLDLYRTVSILGYSLVPIVILSFLLLGLFLKKSSLLAFILSALAVAWSTNTATMIFVQTLSMKEQRWLLAYPLALLYASFVLITVF